MKDRFVLTVAMDGKTGEMNIFFGNGIEIPEKAEAGETLCVRLGGGLSIPIILNMLLTTYATLKNKALENPELKEHEKLELEQELYDMLNIAVGGFLDQGFPLVNSLASLTEEACVEYGLDPKTATTEELFAAENKFIEEHPDRASQTADMQLEKPKAVKSAKELS